MPAEKDAFLEKVNEHNRIIFRICNSYCTVAANREDLAQEIIYQLWRSWSSYNAQQKFSTWMYRVALNVAISYYRKHKHSQHLQPLHNDMADAVTDFEKEEKLRMLQQFIDELKELDKALMILYLDAKPYAEIAEILGISTTNVATKIGRIKEQLKQRFKHTGLYN